MPSINFTKAPGNPTAISNEPTAPIYSKNVASIECRLPKNNA